jgi:flagellar P-ring protein FlgI
MKIMSFSALVATAVLLAGQAIAAPAPGETRLKDLSRPRDERPNALVGYGLVTGLAGTGDNPANRLTAQTISNLLQSMGVNIPQQSLRSRNVAAVMVTASLPRYSQSGDLIDVNVTSMGDARSLVGGTLLMTPLKAANGSVFALAQGALSVGGYKYDLNGNVVQKNHPTAGNIPNGATVEQGVPPHASGSDGNVEYVLFDPDLMTVTRIVQAINGAYGGGRARVIDPGRYEVSVPEQDPSAAYEFLARMESLVIAPDQRARVVVNERTGTVVSGGDVRISQTTISHGDLVVAITTDYLVSQPTVFGRVSSPSISTVVVPNTRIDVTEREPVAVNLPTDSTVAELVTALNRVKASSRDVITVLQGLKAAGALHAELVIQ